MAEQAPLLLTFADHASRVARLLKIRPSLMTRLMFAPRSAIHAIGAFLHLAPEAARPDDIVAATIDDTDPRDLLLMAIPDAPPRLFKSLDRAGDTVQNKSFYERLGRLANGPLAMALLIGGRLDDARLDRAERLLALDPIVVHLHRSRVDNLTRAEALEVLVKFLRAHRVPVEEALALPTGGGLKAFVRRIQNALEGLEAPSPPWTLPAVLRVIRTIREMREVGRAMRNCLGRPHDHWFDILAGTHVLIVCEQPAMVAVLQRVGPDIWFLSDLRGHENAYVPSEARAGLENSLRDAGVKLVGDTPVDALRFLSRDLDDADGPRDVDELAAQFARDLERELELAA